MTSPSDAALSTAQSHILVIALRQLGDAVDDAAHSQHAASTSAIIDMLVFADTAPILAGNPDIDRVIAIPPKPAPAKPVAIVRCSAVMRWQCRPRPTTSRSL